MGIGKTSFSRRDFVKSAAALAGFAAFDGLPVFAAPPGWKPKKKPNLVFGVVSDTHMRCHYDGESFYLHYDAYYDDQALVEVMKLFKKAGVDAILHCGDITDGGMVREMMFYKEAWDKVYGSDPRPVNLMVTGNHDVAESYYWAQCVSHSKDPAVYKKIRLGPHNIKQEMECIWGFYRDEKGRLDPADVPSRHRRPDDHAARLKRPSAIHTNVSASFN